MSKGKAEQKAAPGEAEDLVNWTQIQNKYAFHFKDSSSKSSQLHYIACLKKIATFQTVERFWQIYDHLKRPNDFKISTEYHLFKDGISPFWEDANNINGGKWTLKLKKGISSRYWEEIVLAIIGEQFDVGAEICGAVLSIRSNEDILSVWNRTADNYEAINKIRDQIRRILNLPPVIALEYKIHQDSLAGKRNPALVWRSSSAMDEEGGHGHAGTGAGGTGGGGGGKSFHARYEVGGKGGGGMKTMERGERDGGGGGGGTYHNKRFENSEQTTHHGHGTGGVGGHGGDKDKPQREFNSFTARAGRTTAAEGAPAWGKKPVLFGTTTAASNAPFGGEGTKEKEERKEPPVNPWRANANRTGSFGDDAAGAKTGNDTWTRGAKAKQASD